MHDGLRIVGFRGGGGAAISALSEQCNDGEENSRHWHGVSLPWLLQLLSIFRIERFRRTDGGVSRNAVLLRHLVDERIFLRKIMRRTRNRCLDGRYARRTNR